MAGSKPGGPPPVVLQHGAWHGGWCWRRVAALLAAAGHPVFTPTLTGLGERAHLLTPAVGLDTFIADLAGMIEAEELEDVVLVGHSFGGCVISGVAERLRDRIRHLVYLDATLVGPGERPFDLIPPEMEKSRREAAWRSSGGLSMPAPPPDVFGVFAPADQAWLARRLTPHPLKSYDDKLRLGGPIGAGLPRTYVAATAPLAPSLEPSRARLGGLTGWDIREIAAGHDLMIAAPAETARLIQEIAGGGA